MVIQSKKSTATPRSKTRELENKKERKNQRRAKKFRMEEEQREKKAKHGQERRLWKGGFSVSRFTENVNSW
jgi:hypothetical protein